MYPVEKARNYVEPIHIDFLCRHFLLKPGGFADLNMNGANPDLVNRGQEVKAVFELKSRNFPRNQNAERKRPISDFAWWFLEPEQIKRYEEFQKANPQVNLYWIFLLSQTRIPPTELPKLWEASFLERDIYVVPWAAHELVELTDSEKKHIGRARILENYDFREKVIQNGPVKKGRLYIAKTIDAKVRSYF